MSWGARSSIMEAAETTHSLEKSGGEELDSKLEGMIRYSIDLNQFWEDSRVCSQRGRSKGRRNQMCTEGPRIEH
jgi:hypothetical protein